MVFTKSRLVSLLITLLATFLVLIANLTILRYSNYIEPLDLFLIEFVDLLILCTWFIFFYSCRVPKSTQNVKE